MGVHDACEWAFMIVAPGGAGKGWSTFFRIRVDNGNIAFLVFASKFCNEREVTGAIERGLDLENELRKVPCSGVSSVIVAVGKNLEC